MHIPQQTAEIPKQSLWLQFYILIFEHTHTHTQNYTDKGTNPLHHKVAVQLSNMVNR
jgi:hypothetical protein